MRWIWIGGEELRGVEGGKTIVGYIISEKMLFLNLCLQDKPPFDLLCY